VKALFLIAIYLNNAVSFLEMLFLQLTEHINGPEPTADVTITRFCEAIVQLAPFAALILAFKALFYLIRRIRIHVHAR
jgi:hypothetical protein